MRALSSVPSTQATIDCAIGVPLPKTAYALWLFLELVAEFEAELQPRLAFVAHLPNRPSQG